MGSVHRHSSGRSPFYYAKFVGADGTICVKSTKQRNWQKAVEICSKWERAARQGRSGSLTEVQAQKVLSEIFEVATGKPLQIMATTVWMNDWLKGKQLTKAEGTYKRYKLLVERFLKSLGEKAAGNLANITLHDVQKFRDSELEGGVAPASADLAVKTLRIPFNLARRQGHITINPAEGVELLHEGGESRDLFTTDQVQKIVKAATGEWVGVIRYGYYTGARLGNCARLRWDQINWEKLTVVYEQEKRMRGKKSKPVVIPLHPVLANELRARRRLRSKSEYVFPTLSTTSISGKTGLSQQFGAIMVNAEIVVPTGPKRKGRGRQFRRLGYHSLKHTFISTLASGQVSPEIRKLLVGHKSDRVHDVYTHIDLPVLSAAVAQLPVV